MTDSKPMLEARNVAFSWPGNAVLEDVTLAVERGTVMCLMGPNGCGKSTFIDCVLGSNAIASGEIRIDGRDVSELDVRQRARLVSYVPQVHGSTFPYTVEHMVLMGRAAYLQGLGTPADEDLAIVRETLETCCIPHLAQRVCTELSGGEMQMVMLARALAQRTPLIVLDEPTAHLDFRNELVFLETIEMLAAREGATVLMATHSPNQAFHLEAAGLDVSVALLSGGRVMQVGAPGEVLSPESVRRCFGVVARTYEPDGDTRADGSLRAPARQIVPLCTSHGDDGGDSI